ncbi:hypothetical protein [Vibrio sp. WXL210]|uniref:hypothetical protein n=1 Tax=Vibrio sp. WXL210 TaxID=3450709 RepID=UPI003EC75E7A
MKTVKLTKQANGTFKGSDGNTYKALNADLASMESHYLTDAGLKALTKQIG